MNTTTDLAASAARIEDRLRHDFPNWNIVHSSADRWWAFLDTRQRGKTTVSTGTTDVDADTPEELYELLAAVES